MSRAAQQWVSHNYRLAHKFRHRSTLFVVKHITVFTNYGININQIIKKCSLIRPPDVSREGLKFYPWTLFLFFSFLFINTCTAFSSRAVDGHQMYSGGSAAGKASTIGIEISSTLPLIFTGDQKVRNLVSFSTSDSRSKMHQGIRTQKQISCVRMIVLCGC